MPGGPSMTMTSSGGSAAAWMARRQRSRVTGWSVAGMIAVYVGSGMIAGALLEPGSGWEDAARA
jgi:hypothetical protein